MFLLVINLELVVVYFLPHLGSPFCVRSFIMKTLRIPAAASLSLHVRIASFYVLLPLSLGATLCQSLLKQNHCLKAIDICSNSKVYDILLAVYRYCYCYCHLGKDCYTNSMLRQAVIFISVFFPYTLRNKAGL